MKPQHKTLLRNRAQSALADIYHNATIGYPRELYGRTAEYCDQWIQDQAQFEIEYIADGGATPGDYRATLAHPCNAGKYKSERARRYYVRKGLRDRDMERDDCGMLTGWRVLELAAGNLHVKTKLMRYTDLQRNNALWERITDYGKLYQYGRGGRTLAPDDLIKQRGGSSFSINEEYADELSATACVELIRVVESFNRVVSDWCNGVPEMWKEHCQDEDRQIAYEKKQASIKKGKETKERNYWAFRDCVTA